MFLIFALIISQTLFATSITTQEYINQAEKLKLHTHRQWERLLHLEHGITGKKSEADSDNFFSSKDTIDNPKAELQSIIRLIIDGQSPTGDENIICRFPARAKWLKQHLSLPEQFLNFSQCQKYNNYIKNNIKENQVISLVFSSYYLESPASAFGHTFFRIKNKGKSITQENPNELLDTGISYAANMTTNNALLYAVLGIAGGFYGEYSLLPYYYKIREYNDFESRDLWSYDLNLNDEQIYFLMDHLWELGHTQFRYFYFTENCSYELLRLLEATDPKLHLVDQIPFYIIPVDTLKAVYRSNLVSNVEFRPSSKRKFDYFLSQLNESEKKVFFDLIQTKSSGSTDLSKMEGKSQVMILDTLMQYLDFKYSKEILNQKGAHFEWKQKVLRSRSEHPTRGVDENIKLPTIESPHLGHDSTRAGVFLGNHQNFRHFTEVHYRFAMHDVLDPRMGHPPHANLEFFDIQMRYYEELKKLTIHDWTFVDVMTLNPWNDYQSPTSLKANIGLRRKPLFQCEGCLTLNAEIGGGFTKQIKKTTFYFMGETDTSYSGVLTNYNLEMALGPSLNILQSWSNEFLGQVTIKYLHYLQANREVMSYDFEHRYHFKNDFSLSYHFNIWGDDFQHKFGLFYYF